MKLIQKPGPHGLAGEASGRDRRQPWSEVAAFAALAIVLVAAVLMMLPLG